MRSAPIACESVVAKAAPSMPQPKGKTKSQSRKMLRIDAAILTPMAMLGAPSRRRMNMPSTSTMMNGSPGVM